MRERPVRIRPIVVRRSVKDRRMSFVRGEDSPGGKERSQAMFCKAFPPQSFFVLAFLFLG